MTNHKELAERIVKQLFGINNLSEFDDEVKEVESILSEYQGEAVGIITSVDFEKEILEVKYSPKAIKEFTPDMFVYLTAPLKKEE